MEKDHGIIYGGIEDMNQETEGIDFEIDEEAAGTLLDGSDDECLEGSISGSGPGSHADYDGEP
jgi:hypothetical protein